MFKQLFKGAMGTFFCLLLLGVAKADCNISDEKRQLVTSILCGNNSGTPDYMFSGQGCVAKSLKERVETTVMQSKVFQFCGDKLFAQKLLESTNGSKFLEVLSVCASEKIDLNAMKRDAIDAVEIKAIQLQCTPELRAKISQRKPALEQQISQANDPSLFPAILDKLNLNVSPDGSISERK